MLNHGTCQEQLARKRRSTAQRGKLWLRRQKTPWRPWRIDALTASDVNARNEIIDAHGIHIESNGALRTKAEFLKDVSSRWFSFDLFEIDENDIRIFGDTAVMAGTYRNVVRVRGRRTPMKHVRHLQVYVYCSGSWKLVAHQAVEIVSRPPEILPAMEGVAVMINVLTLEPGMRVRLVDGATAEVVSNPRDGIWILLRYLTGPDSSAQSNGEELVFAENIVELL